MASKGKHYDVAPLYQYFEILPLESNIKLQQGKFVLKLVANKILKSILEIFPLNISEAINNFGQNKYILPFHRTTLGKNSLSFKGLKLWNNEITLDLKRKKTIKKVTFPYSCFTIFLF